MTSILMMLAICFGMVLAILAIIFLVVPLLRGIGWMIGGLFGALGWLLRHIFEFIGGMLSDAVRMVGAVIAWIVLVPLVLLNVIIGRWSASGHFFRSMKREFGVGTTCLYRVVLQRPLRFLLLGGLLEGIEERVNEAWEAAPTADKPSRHTGSFDGYTIVGSLPGGGSGAKLYIADPDDSRRRKNPKMPRQVVIKSFTLTDGSTLPQIVRESRALEAAKQLGLVLEHGMDEHRFFYVMPYHRGDHLGIVTRQLHGRSDGQGLNRHQIGEIFGYIQDLATTLARYHEGGLWHKDVKPDNIIVHDGRAHLVDLGLVTPLRSAMTLTTHGTEYFRDPEMVRMALRGVKVHQVDGAKFDIYAAGAVLYFVLENTFPAHGGLSAFSRQSPEAARWIVRRAMTDYNKRYDTMGQMLADLSFVAAAADPFAVKPAHLPSMRGGAAEPLDGMGQVAAAINELVPEVAAAINEFVPEIETLVSAGSPVPPKEPDDVKVYGMAIGFGKSDAPAKAPPERGPRRPRLKVTNWWTGAYQVEDSGGSGGPGEEEAIRVQAKALRDQVRGMREQTDGVRRQVQMGHMTARRAAREQIKEARARARNMQRRARAMRHRPAPLAPRQPSGMMAFLALATVVGFAVVGLGLWQSRGPDQRAAVGAQVFATGQPRVAGPLSLLLINDHPAAANPKVRAEIARIVQLHESKGWEVVLNDETAEVEVRKYLPAGPVDPAEPNPLLRNTLRNLDLGGILRIRTYPGEGDPHERINAVMLAMPHGPDAPLVRLAVPVNIQVER